MTMVEKSEDEIFESCFGEEALARYKSVYPEVSAETLNGILQSHEELFREAAVHSIIPSFIEGALMAARVRLRNQKSSD